MLHGRDYWRSVADMRLLRSYERERKAAMLPMSLATDGLQQLFSRTETRCKPLRNWGCAALNATAFSKLDRPPGHGNPLTPAHSDSNRRRAIA